MNYLITNNAEEISQELYRLSRPNNFRTQDRVFEVFEKDGEFALAFDPLYEILVHPQHNSTQLLGLFGYTGQVKIDIRNYISSIQKEQTPPEPPSGYVLGRFTFQNILDPSLDVKDEQWMIDNGWITAEVLKSSFWSKVTRAIKKSLSFFRIFVIY